MAGEIMEEQWKPIPNAPDYNISSMKRLRSCHKKNVEYLVYFIEGAGRIKIGIAKNIEERFRVIQTGSPVPLTLITSIPGGHKLEKELHERFEHLLCHGEWFEAAPELMRYIESQAGKEA